VVPNKEIRRENIANLEDPVQVVIKQGEIVIIVVVRVVLLDGIIIVVKVEEKIQLIGNMVVMIVEGIPDEVVVVKQENIGVTDRMDVVVEIVIIVGLGILIMIMFQVRPLKLLMMMEEEREVDHIVVLTEREGITQSIAAPSIDESIVHRNESMRMIMSKNMITWKHNQPLILRVISQKEVRGVVIQS